MAYLKKVFVLIGSLIMISSFPIITQESDQGDTLEYKEAIFARRNSDGRMVHASQARFRRGENVYLVLLNVGKFQPGEDGRHWFDMDMLVKGPQGETVLDQKNLLGEEGHVRLPEGIAKSPMGIFKTHVGLDAGAYQMQLTLIDKIGAGTLKVSKTLFLTEELGYQKSFLARRDQDNKLEPVEDAVFNRGEIINFVLLNVGQFEKGSDGKHRFDIDLEVTNSDGKVILDNKGLLGEKGHVLLENNIADSPYGIFYSTLQTDSGEYTITLTILDRVGDRKLRVSRKFTLR